jgi:hypothetical protein
MCFAEYVAKETVVNFEVHVNMNFLLFDFLVRLFMFGLHKRVEICFAVTEYVYDIFASCEDGNELSSCTKREFSY